MRKEAVSMRQEHETFKGYALSEAEILQLMQVFTRGKTCIVEDDAITLLRWANEQRSRAVILDMVLAGEIIPSVADGEVTLALAMQEAEVVWRTNRETP